VRIGTAEIYRQVEKLPEVIESIVIGQDWPPGNAGDVRVVLFVKLREGLVAYTTRNILLLDFCAVESLRCMREMQSQVLPDRCHGEGGYRCRICVDPVKQPVHLSVSKRPTEYMTKRMGRDILCPQDPYRLFQENAHSLFYGQSPKALVEHCYNLQRREIALVSGLDKYSPPCQEFPLPYRGLR
jgi:hypothetical protein